jgi:hypothetical protein
MSRISYSRRSLLQALAASAVTLPFARELRAGPAVAPPKRLMIFMQNNGTQQSHFWPDANLSSSILDALFLDPVTGADNGLKAKTNIIKGVFVPFVTTDTGANQHDMGFARMFTGAPLMNIGGQPWGGAASVDQILAQAWGVDTLTLAVLASEVEPHPKRGFDHRESFSYRGPGIIEHPHKDPLEVYNTLFPPQGGAAARRASVLDAVAANLADVSARLGTHERNKLDYHLQAIRQVETSLRSLPQCPVPSPPPNYLAIDPNSEINEDTYIPSMVDNMIDLALLSLQCGIRRIASLQFGYGGGKWKFAWKGINMNCHDDVAHLDTSDGGSSKDNTDRVVLMNQYYASRVARFATALDAIKEGNGTMLDNSLVVWANEFGRGDHNQSNVPIVLIGRAAGAIPAGGRVLDPGHPQVFNRLGCTILNVMGMSAPGFGDVPDCGVFEGLL